MSVLGQHGLGQRASDQCFGAHRRGGRRYRCVTIRVTCRARSVGTRDAALRYPGSRCRSKGQAGKNLSARLESTGTTVTGDNNNWFAAWPSGR